MESRSDRDAILRRGAWLFFAVFLFFYLSLFKHALIDDAFITLQYVKVLLASGTWGLYSGTVANSATSPLNVLLLTIVSLLTGPGPDAALWLYFLCTLFTAFLLARFSWRLTGSEQYGWLAVLALLANPLLISTMGLESILFTALFVFALYCRQLQRWGLLAVALGLLTLTRPEGALFFPIFLLSGPSNRARMQMTVVYILCIAPWYLFSWIVLGSFVPDTFFIKTEQGTWFQWDFFNGITSLYSAAYPREVAFSFVFFPLLVLLFHRRVRGEQLLVIIWLAGLMHFTGYSLLRVPPFHWYYVPQVITIILFGSLGLGVIREGNAVAWQRKLLRGVTVLYSLVPIAGMLLFLAREGWKVGEMPIHSNWGTHQQYRQIGLWLKEQYAGDTIRLEGGEIGTIAYYCECQLLDRFSDRRWLGELIAEKTAEPGFLSAIWKLNFAFYEPPFLPPEDYVLRAYVAEPHLTIDILEEWTTSTQWIPHGFLLLSRE